MGAESSSESSSTLPAILPARGCLLCFDFGIKRIGVATGELETSLASPLTIISHESRAARFGAIARLVQEWRPVAFVVGWPRPLDDVDNVHVMQPHCRRFANQLQGRFGLPVHLADERLTSVEAERALKMAVYNSWQTRKDKLDALAAQFILQDFLDAHQHAIS